MNLRPLSKSTLPDFQVKKVQNAEVKDLPYIHYHGAVKYYTTFGDCAFACYQLLEYVQNHTNSVVMGFDMEWPFSFQTGSDKTALIQISPSLTNCILLHVAELAKLPKSLTDLLSHPNVRLTGVNIKNDIRKLATDFPGVNGDLIIQNCIELETMATPFFNGARSMQALVTQVLSMQIDKNGAVRRSKWNVMPLSKEQIKYAATDAFVSLKLYLHLKGLEDKHDAILKEILS